MKANLFSFINIITPILGGDGALLVITHNIESHHSMTQLFCVGAPDKNISDTGATALVEVFKEMANLEKLKLKCELWIVDIPRPLAVMR